MLPVSPTRIFFRTYSSRTCDSVAHTLALCAYILHLAQQQFFNLTTPLAGDQQAATTGLFAGPDTNDLTTAQGQLQQARSRLGQSYARIPPEYQQVMS